MEETLNNFLEILKAKLFGRISWNEKTEVLEAEIDDYAENFAILNHFETELSKLIIKIFIYQLLLYNRDVSKSFSIPQLNETNISQIEELMDVIQFQNELGVKQVDETIFLPFGSGAGKEKVDCAHSLFDINSMKSFLTEAEKDNDLKKLAEIIGRHGGATDKKQNFAKSFRPAIAYDGITYSDNLKTLLPSEIALHRNSETRNYFMQKFADKQLQTYKLGNDNSYSSKGQKKKGPVIVCIDTSGSMAGSPERIAKAMVMVLVKEVLKENRELLLINFSTDYEKIEFSKKNFDMTKLQEFISKSFCAGTDIAGALEYALEKQKDKLENADILLISDFCDNMDNNQIREIESLKKNGTIFYGLHIKPKYSYFSKLILNLMDVVITKTK